MSSLNIKHQTGQSPVRGKWIVLRSSRPSKRTNSHYVKLQMMTLFTWRPPNRLYRYGLNGTKGRIFEGICKYNVLYAPLDFLQHQNNGKAQSVTRWSVSEVYHNIERDILLNYVIVNSCRPSHTLCLTIRKQDDMTTWQHTLKTVYPV